MRRKLSGAVLGGLNNTVSRFPSIRQTPDRRNPRLSQNWFFRNGLRIFDTYPYRWFARCRLFRFYNLEKLRWIDGLWKRGCYNAGRGCVPDFVTGINESGKGVTLTPGPQHGGSTPEESQEKSIMKLARLFVAGAVVAAGTLATSEDAQAGGLFHGHYYGRHYGNYYGSHYVYSSPSYYASPVYTVPTYPVVVHRPVCATPAPVYVAPVSYVSPAYHSYGHYSYGYYPRYYSSYGYYPGYYGRRGELEVKYKWGRRGLRVEYDYDD